MAAEHGPVPPAALVWQEDGELSAEDAFQLVCRLRQVEESERSNELWRLGQKVPRGSAARVRSSES